MTNKSNAILLIISFLIFSCSKSKNENNIDPTIIRPNGWSEATHSNNIEPNFEAVFPDFKLNSITINLGKEKWKTISDNMVSLTALNFGGAVAAGVSPPAGGNLDAVPGDPIFVSTNLEHQGKTWQNIGFRLKGNASLLGSWRAGIYKLPFKLKFDEFESSYPEIHNQRFYGFKELSFSPCYGDNSFVKDKVVADLFRAGGVPACRTAFYKVYIDFGEGVKYCGIYTAIEVVDDTFIKTQYDDSKGNVYKPESNFLTFEIAKFEKQNNKTNPNFSDVQSIISILNSPTRNSDRKLWKKQLEGVFDVQLFLKWMAINNTIVNWDTYGVLTHNYYIYNHKGKIKWIPYDHNLSMQFQGGLNNSRFAISLELKELTNLWPLMKYLTDDPDYFDDYKGYVKDFIKKEFNPADLDAKISKYYQMLVSSIVGVEGEQPKYTHLSNQANFINGINNVKSHLYARYSAANTFVSK